jgi:ubiquitin-conjugating enzyme E2 R
VISLLNEPNTFSPANVDASGKIQLQLNIIKILKFLCILVMYRRWRDSNGRDNEYPNIIRKQALQAKLEAEKEGIVVPLTLEEYCLKPKSNPNNQEPQV